MIETIIQLKPRAEWRPGLTKAQLIAELNTKLQIPGVVNGWNFGDGHFHNKQLLDVVQEKCAYEEGELRVVVLEGQPAHVQRQHYWVYDAATGLIEEGWVDVAEMCKRGPWLEESFEFPVETVRSRTAAA